MCDFVCLFLGFKKARLEFVMLGAIVVLPRDYSERHLAGLFETKHFANFKKYHFLARFGSCNNCIHKFYCKMRINFVRKFPGNDLFSPRVTG